MIVQSVHIDLDIQDYIESKGLQKVRPVGDNIMACCPFHDERSPSFGINVETGVYNCFGCGAKGKIGDLVKLLDGFDTAFDAELFLVKNYGRYAVSIEENLELNFEDEAFTNEYYIDDVLLTNYMYRHPYLTSRGIQEPWQRFFDIGYSSKHKAVTIPWRDEFGRLLTVKFRGVNSKKFWYAPPLPNGIKNQTLWGLDKIIKFKLNTVALTEAEIDGMSVWQAGISRGVGAVGIGGNQFSQAQANKLLRYLPEETEIIIFTDNDKGGKDASDRITDLLVGRFKVTMVNWSLIKRQVKDANDLTEEEIHRLLDSRITTGVKLQFN